MAAHYRLLLDYHELLDVRARSMEACMQHHRRHHHNGHSIQRCGKAGVCRSMCIFSTSTTMVKGSSFSGWSIPVRFGTLLRHRLCGPSANGFASAAVVHSCHGM